jgi:hypothetical protein
VRIAGRCAAALATVVTALAAAGCGGDDGGQSATEEWADGVCSAFLDWTTTVSSVGDSLQEGVSRESIETAADDLTGATEQLVDDLRGLGRPDTEAGQQAQDSLEELSQTLEDDLNEIESAVEGSSGLSGAAEALSAVATTLTSMGAAVTRTFQELGQLDAADELEQSFEQSDACTDLTERPPS